MTVEATWNIGLWCECPHCSQYVDLLSYGDFWDGRQLEIGEHETENSRDIEVVCPECEQEFPVTLTY